MLMGKTNAIDKVIAWRVSIVLAANPAFAVTLIRCNACDYATWQQGYRF